jgi:hypothetical protein
MESFARVARYLNNPLALVGYVLFLVFGIFKAIISAGIIPTLNVEGGARIAEHLLLYGFTLALCVVVLGLGLQFYQLRRSTVSPREIKAQHEELKGQNEKLLAGQERLAGMLAPVMVYVNDERQIQQASAAERQWAKATIRDAEELIGSMRRRLTPKNFVLVGYLYWLAGEFSKAIECFKQVIGEGPDDPVIEVAPAEDAVIDAARQGLAVLYQIQANEAIRRGASSHAR